jgi:predicted acetyltransferase
MTIARSGDTEVLVAGTEDRSIIERLIQLYLYDMASEARFPLGADGSYDYGLLDQFWEHPYLLRVAGEIAGFALVIGNCPITQASRCWFMAEFFVLRPYRLNASGRALFSGILARHPGRWHVASQVQNRGAEAFWSRVIDRDSSATFDARFDDADWTVRTFFAENGAVTPPRAGSARDGTASATRRGRGIVPQG